ncbi:MAG TPA: cytochrome c biogenesis heme-transporting ATPase CcmA [Gammaproteobacteria bacterium]|nr:cytochrome c biogenesis heme-transporting ATPase CcmA [Gammaproteobacteria bacterium]
MLKVNSLSGEWDSRVLFSGLTFEVAPGSALIVSGANGAGKSSLLKILTSLSLPSSGNIRWQDQLFKAGDPDVLSQLLYIGHKIGVQPALTPLQNLEWMTGISRKSVVKNCRLALEAVGLAEFEDVRCEVLSKGQCQRVALARLWLDPPICWILDEPFTALDETGVSLLQDRFLTHLKQGGILVVATHHKIALKPYPCQEIRLEPVKDNFIF